MRFRTSPSRGTSRSEDGEGSVRGGAELRRENIAGDCWNLVGFQTNLTFGEQMRVFGMIPLSATPNSCGTASCTATLISTPRGVLTQISGSRERMCCTLRVS